MLHATSKTVLLGLAASALLFTSCQKEPVSPPDTAPTVRALTDAENATVNSANDFAFRAFGTLRNAAAADNLCISPLSISAALTMAYNGADGSTKADMKQTLGFTPQTDAEINESFRTLFSLLRGIDPAVTFTSANSIWHGQQYQLATTFAQQNQAAFDARVQAVDFGSAQTKDLINNWVSAATQGKISTILDETRPDDVMYLINALYFKGSWTSRFDPLQTRAGQFFPEGRPATTAQFMNLNKGKYYRYADAQQQVIDLPYGNRQFSMTLVVPQGQQTLADVTGRLTRTQLSTWLAAADSTRLQLQLPKFKLEYEKELKEALTQLGMGVAFTGQANFRRMLASNSNGLVISKVKHKTYLDVNEEGTEAAAVTSVGIINTSMPQIVQVNRPFVFLIREKSSNAILFIGQVTNL